MRTFLKLAAATIAASILLPGMAKAEDPIFVDWTSVLPGFTSEYDPDSTNECTAGKEACVHSVIREMTRRFDPLADACDHDSMFALTYLRTTEEYHSFWHEGHFSDPRWLNHYDAVFASYYFDAADDWNHDRLSEVPAAWQVAFDAADHQKVSGFGNVFLGMNAHINRDLPFVLADIGLVAPDGSSRKPDHDTVNQFLNRISDVVFPEMARRFDPTIDDGQIPGTLLDDFASFQIVPEWRENAWRNAERLVNASSAAERASVAQQIEDAASVEAQAIKAATQYSLLSANTASQRNAYCAVHHDEI